MVLFTIETLSAFLTPLIGIVTLINLIIVTYVAYQLYRLKKIFLDYQIHRDLYKKRLKVFHQTMELLRTIVNEQRPSWKSLLSTLRKIEDDSYFLFGYEIHEYINTLIDKGNEKNSLYRKMFSTESTNEKEKIVRKTEELEHWFFDQFDTCRDKFEKYLSYDDYI